MSLLKPFFCGVALVGLIGCGQQPESEETPTHVAYCLDDPSSPEVKIIATQTNDLMYRAQRPGNAGVSTLLRTFDGTAEKRVLAVTPEACEVYGNRGPVIKYTRISSPL
jgi:hypothetical protein